MSMNLDPNIINKGVETMKNISKVAANLTDNKPQKPAEQKPEQMNQPHTQTVEVKVGETTPQQKPTIIKEKSETHVHKVFPDQRELSERECAVRELELKFDHELKMREQALREEIEMQNLKDRREREEYERKERERRRERDRKSTRNFCIFLGAMGVAAMGFAAYDFYTGSRNAPRIKLALRSDNPVETEGTVE